MPSLHIYGKVAGYKHYMGLRDSGMSHTEVSNLLKYGIVDYALKHFTGSDIKDRREYVGVVGKDLEARLPQWQKKYVVELKQRKIKAIEEEKSRVELCEILSLGRLYQPKKEK